MPASSHIDSPIHPTFPCRTSAASVQSPLTRIIEAPHRQFAMLDSPTIIQPRPTQSDDYMTFLDSDSDSCTNSPSSSPNISPIMSQEQFPYFLSLDNLGFEDDWTQGWDNQEARAVGIASEQPRLREVGELPVIREGDFNYIPASAGVRTQWRDNASDRSLSLARDRMAKRADDAKYGYKMAWLKVLLKKLGLGGRRGR
ncbi:hypothetical protein HBI13_207760 [Parastagonospora nodorum]|nr:hypothetical protein HBI10_215780 [Parastagonospora nodorum]KAH4010423.1 hypothetical protein HBI13_207760 [Parastagonospora nodorum]KAH4156377.1 hypothetical protein HBH43_207030 [Parastagonospora nodorum]KAH4798945.1 hypothetical protein HBH61_235360 [Parastagonospora nodorum]KAH5014829.1 hypothetical protein HBI75_188800 [Parastagonospora nodorum]